MANLIITVIAIALTAIAALMGAYYGGTAFIDGQAKAQANQLIEGAKQIASAWTLYANDRGGNYTVNDIAWEDGTMTDFVPAYLSSWKKYDFVTACSSYPLNVKLLADGTTVNSAADSNFIQFCGVPQKVCEQINLIATGSKTVPTGWTGAQRYAAAKPFICDYSTSQSLNYFRYRVF